MPRGPAAVAPPPPVPAALLRDQTWLMGPAAVGPDGVQAGLLRRFAVPEAHQRIFQNNAAAVEEAKRGGGVAFAVSFAVQADLASERLVRLPLPAGAADGGVEHADPRRAVPAAGGRRVHPLRRDAAGDPGDAARGRRRGGALPARRST